MSNTANVLEAGTVKPSRAPVFTSAFLWGFHPVSCVYNVSNICGLSFPDCCFGFL